MPSVDIDTDSDNSGTIERSDWEESIENEADYTENTSDSITMTITRMKFPTIKSTLAVKVGRRFQIRISFK